MTALDKAVKSAEIKKFTDTTARKSRSNFIIEFKCEKSPTDAASLEVASINVRSWTVHGGACTQSLPRLSALLALKDRERHSLLLHELLLGRLQLALREVVERKTRHNRPLATRAGNRERVHQA